MNDIIRRWKLFGKIKKWYIDDSISPQSQIIMYATILREIILQKSYDEKSDCSRPFKLYTYVPYRI